MHDMIKKLRNIHVICTNLILLSLLFLGFGCNDDKEVFQTGNGYVQFKVYKSASYVKDEASRAGGNVLDSLYEANKVKVVLRSNDYDFSQTLMLHAYDEQSAEYGLRSDKLELQPGEYTVVGFYLYDRAEKEPIFAGIPSEKTTFTIVSGGLVMQDLLVDAIGKGLVKFELIKNIQSSRGASDSEPYPFSDINKVDIKVQNMDTKETQEFKSLKVTYVEDFDGQGIGYRTSVGRIDTLVTAEAGNYKILSYAAYNRTELLQYFNDEVLGEATFTVTDNKQTEAKVPVTILETAANIKDYYNLRTLWEQLGGQNWSYVGESYPQGTNWDFENKDVDMWGDQPGVSLDKNGRVIGLSIGDFNPTGEVPDVIGEFTELQSLALGTHNDKLRPGENPLADLKGGLTPAVLEELRSDYMDNFALRDSRQDWDVQMQRCMVESGQPAIKKSIVQPKDVIHGDMTNGIKGISEAIGKLQKLEVLYIANSPIAELPQALGDLESCTDLEIYNCSRLTAFPDQLARMKNLTQLNMAMNPQLAAAFPDGIKKLAEGDAGKSLQILYLGYNNIASLPAEVSKMKKLGKIDLIYNKLTALPAFGKDVNLVQGTFDYNKIASIATDENGIFCGMDDVESLSFSHNELTEFPDIFDASSIYIMASVNFSYNKIKKVATKKGINVNELSLAGNELEKFPADLFKTNSPLTVLNLSGNRIKDFTNEDMKGAKVYMMTSFDLSNNRLEKLPDDLNGTTMPHLYGIDISGNQLSAFPWGLANISYLNTLIMRNQRDDDGNRVYKEWPTNIGNHKGLRALLLGGNDIGKVPETEKLSYLINTLDVSDNPNLILNVSSVCPYIKAGMYLLIYDTTQDIRGCDYLTLE
ncbi:leucine Rich Repeat protein [Phocaeicola plebeius DSM 17135]|uniref:Leucine Rich Repeat protein n=2 Tax=Phocaeicola plebeius TaxID=310297 RepID=B5D3L8_PHOPM|nr:leucine Rich Repeat protein [Phocaeicola plebeius DSM 17135]